VKQDVKVLLESKSKFLLVHVSSGHKHVLKEVLADPAVTVKLADTKVMKSAVLGGQAGAYTKVMKSAVLGGQAGASKLGLSSVLSLSFLNVLCLQAASEVKALESFYHMLQVEPDRAYYG